MIPHRSTTPNRTIPSHAISRSSCGVSSAVERLLYTQRVAGSNPAPRTITPSPALAQSLRELLPTPCSSKPRKRVLLLRRRSLHATPRRQNSRSRGLSRRCLPHRPAGHRSAEAGSVRRAPSRPDDAARRRDDRHPPPPRRTIPPMLKRSILLTASPDSLIDALSGEVGDRGSEAVRAAAAHRRRPADERAAMSADLHPASRTSTRSCAWAPLRRFRAWPHGDFVSITRTPDELSIVCRQDGRCRPPSAPTAVARLGARGAVRARSDRRGRGVHAGAGRGGGEPTSSTPPSTPTTCSCPTG